MLVYKLCTLVDTHSSESSPIHNSAAVLLVLALMTAKKRHFGYNQKFAGLLRQNHRCLSKLRQSRERNPLSETEDGKMPMDEH